MIRKHLLAALLIFNLISCVGSIQEAQEQGRSDVGLENVENQETTSVDNNVEESADQVVAVVDPGSPFITEWHIAEPNTEIVLPLRKFDNAYKNYGGEEFVFNFMVDWGDGTALVHVDSYESENKYHVYKEPGNYIVSISGRMEAMFFPWYSDWYWWDTNGVSIPRDKLIAVHSMGKVGWKTLYGAFYFTNLKTFKLGDTDLSEVEDISSMFGLSPVESVDLRKADLSNVKTAQSMFHHASSLTQVFFPKNLSSLVNGQSMLNGTSVLKEIDFSDTDFSSLENAASFLHGAKQLQSADFRNVTAPQLKNMRNFFAVCPMLNEIHFEGFDFSAVEDLSKMFLGALAIKNLDFLKGKNFAKVKNAHKMFYAARSLESAKLNEFDFSSLEDASAMFCSADALKHVDLSNMNLSQLKNMEKMFSDTETLSEVKFDGANLTQVRNMVDMFHEADRIKTVRFENLDLKSLDSAAGMFKGADSVKEISFSGSDISELKFVRHMFFNTPLLSIVDFRKTTLPLPGERVGWPFTLSDPTVYCDANITSALGKACN